MLVLYHASLLLVLVIVISQFSCVFPHPIHILINVTKNIAFPLIQDSLTPSQELLIPGKED